jgi:hypothetical protein|tara:strand:+ start:1222 stop:2151 length:930 start_codon:yes stop_codon:yes gene_type:complete
MSALVNRLKEQYETQYQHSITPVELRQLNSVESDFVLNKPSYAVLDTENNRAIHLHGANYQLIPYEKILVGLSDALDKYNIDINDASLKFKVSPDLNYMRLRILFGDTGDFGAYSMKYDTNDKLKFGIEVISSYDASIIYQLRAMFLRLVCDNGMKSFENINSSMKRHTLNFNLDDSFTKLEYLNKTFDSLKNTVEVYQSVELNRVDVEKLFKKFSKNSDGKYHILTDILETDINKSTLYDVYNALTNYSSHNQRAIKIGKRDSEDYKIETSKKDMIRSNEDRDFEVRNFLQSNDFLFYYHKGVSNQLQ